MNVELLIRAFNENPINSARTHWEVIQQQRDENAIIFNKIIASKYIVTDSILEEDTVAFQWNGETFGELPIDKNQAVIKGVVYRKYREVAPLWLASATLSIPYEEGIQTAFITSQLMGWLIQEGRTQDLENLAASISQKAYEELCEFFQLPHKETEVLFDDNATLALYQFLSMSDVPANSHLVTMFDIGKTLTQTLSGEKSEGSVFNFQSAIDVWQNSKAKWNETNSIGPFQTHLIEHYSKDKYVTDDDVLEQMYQLVSDFRPKVFVVPTVTRSGRKLPFISLCKQIMAQAKTLGYNPIIILDDAQGMSRLMPQEYQEANVNNQDIWNYADAILGTGAKVTRAISGTGYILINKKRFETFEKKLSASSLKYRSRKYAFISPDQQRVASHNVDSPGIVNSPELATFSIALQNKSLSKDYIINLHPINNKILETLIKTKGVKVLTPEDNKEAAVNSILTFYLQNDLKNIEKLRDSLSEPTGDKGLDALRLSLPKVVPTDKCDYLRVSLDPTRLHESDYPEVIDEFVKRLKLSTKKLGTI